MYGNVLHQNIIFSTPCVRLFSLFMMNKYFKKQTFLRLGSLPMRLTTQLKQNTIYKLNIVDFEKAISLYHNPVKFIRGNSSWLSVS